MPAREKTRSREQRAEDALANMSPDQLAALEMGMNGTEVRACIPTLTHYESSHRNTIARKEGHLNEQERELMSLGREELLMKEAEVFKEIVVKSNNKDRIGLTSVELSYLHQQLQGLTTTCTLVIGFAMAALSADLLVEFGSDQSQFCLYKSLTHTFLAGLFIVLDTTCICVCFTVIAAVQIIIFQSQRAIFSRSMVHKVEGIIERTRRRRPTRRINLTPRVVRMTQLLMYGDKSTDWHSDPARGGKQRSSLPLGGLSIYVGLGVAMVCFFFSTVLLIWIFLSPLAGWKQLPESSTASANNGMVPMADGTNATNGELVHTYEGQWKTKCLDPHDEADQRWRVLMGSIISGIATFVFVANVIFGYWLGVLTMRRYSLESLLELPEEELEMLDSQQGQVMHQDLEDTADGLGASTGGSCGAGTTHVHVSNFAA